MRGKVKKEKEILMLLETKKKHIECKKNKSNKSILDKVYTVYNTLYYIKSIVFLIKMSINKWIDWLMSI